MKRPILTLLISASLILGLAPCYGGDEYSEINGWHFVNFGIDELPWDIFAESYICIDPLDPIDQLFYAAYNAAFAVATGNCFGMSLLSVLILKEEGHLGFCKPVSRYSGDASGPSLEELRRAIIIMQCHEWSHAGISWMLENLLGAHMRDARHAYEQVEYYHSMGDPPLITIVKDENLEGHTLVPYRCEEIGGERRIYVYDPNRYYPPDSAYYDMDSNYIKITSGDWSFKMADTLPGLGPVYGGDESSGGFIFATPSSLVKPTSRNPLELGAVVDDLGTIFMSGAGASVAQITDEKGRRFYKTDADLHTRLSEMEADPTLRMNNIIRWAGSFGKRKGPPPEIYFIRGGSGGDLKLDVASKGGYKCQLARADNLITVEAISGPMGRDRLEVRAVSTERQELTIGSQRGPATFSVELYRTLPVGRAARTFRVSNLRVPRAAPVRLRLTEDLAGLLVNSEAAVEYDLELIQTVGTEISRLQQRGIKAAPGEWHRVRPTNWVNLRDAELIMERPKLEREIRELR